MVPSHLCNNVNGRKDCELSLKKRLKYCLTQQMTMHIFCEQTMNSANMLAHEYGHFCIDNTKKA